MRFVLKTRYAQDVNLFLHSGQVFWYGLLAGVVVVAPLFLDTFYLGEFALVYIWAIAGVGLMLLVGYTGLVSLGHAAFLAIGAYAHAWFLAQGVPFIVSVPLATVFCAVVGYIVGLPALRMTGIYLAVATLAFERIAAWVIEHWESVTGGHFGMRVPDPTLFGMDLDGPGAVLLPLSRRACAVPVRGHEPAPLAHRTGIHRGSGFRGLGREYGHQPRANQVYGVLAVRRVHGSGGKSLRAQDRLSGADAFTVQTSIQLLLMVVVGGLGSLQGVVYGAIFLGLLPQAIAFGRDVLPQRIGEIPGLEPGLFGLILILFLIFEPLGIHGRWVKIRLWFDQFPLYRKATYKRQRSYLRTERVR